MSGSYFNNVESSMLSQVLNQLPYHYGIKDTHSVFQVANNNLAKLMGYEDGLSMTGIKECDIDSPAAKHADEFQRQDQLVMSSGKPLKGINISRYDDGLLKILLGQKEAFRDEEGNIIGVSGSTLDLDAFPVLLNSIKPLIFSEPYFKSLRQDDYLFFSLSETHDDVNLTKRETECLYFMLRGRTSKSIAEILCKSIRTIETHTDHIKEKFDCKSKQELVDKAISLGYLYHIPPSLFPDLGFSFG